MKRQELIRCIILTGLIFLFACSERKTPSDAGRRFLFPTPLLFHSRPDIVFNTTDQQSSNLIWKRTDFAFPQFSGERGKAVAVGDIDGDGNWDVVSTYENAGGKAGVMWTSALFGRNWRDYNVSGTEGKKFDLILLLDMHGDGDLDILTSEENNNSADVKGLGVIWHENPSK
jgi:hypothetical protein